MKTKKVLLTEDEMPRQWYNILADIKMNPPLGPDGNPISPDMLAPVFPMNLIEQEVSSERWIDIPEEVQAVLQNVAAQARWCAPTAWKKRWVRPRAFITSTKASAPPAAISPIPPFRRHITTRFSASNA